MAEQTDAVTSILSIDDQDVLNVCPSLKLALTPLGPPSAGEIVFAGLQLSRVSIGSVIHFAIYVMQVDSGDTLVVGSDDQMVKQGSEQ